MRAIVLMCLLQAALAQFTNPWEGPGKTGPDTDPNAGNACRADQASCSCCLILQQVNRLKTYFNEALFKIERESLLTKQSLNNIEASRTAFSASLYGDEQFRCYGPLNPNSVIIYKNIFLNLGGHYNAGTGIFTAPHSGVYTFAVSVYSDAGAPGNLLSACASLQLNNQLVAASKDQNTNDQEDSATIVVVLQLSAGDQVDVKLPKGCFLCDDSHYNTFSGFLLYLTE
ncbi:complement C1q-like protein 2 [Anabas testudineus]|uniref:C1q domain-containing protein n=1 Tax=Anabas testudineus TaxID=64144 RepID=A0A3Q1KCX8_ANATE|nr:complement C1q-like protein 2 [Anabas testudineus]